MSSTLLVGADAPRDPEPEASALLRRDDHLLGEVAQAEREQAEAREHRSTAERDAMEAGSVIALLVPAVLFSLGTVVCFGLEVAQLVDLAAIRLGLDPAFLLDEPVATRLVVACGAVVLAGVPTLAAHFCLHATELLPNPTSRGGRVLFIAGRGLAGLGWLLFPGVLAALRVSQASFVATEQVIDWRQPLILVELVLAWAATFLIAAFAAVLGHLAVTRLAALMRAIVARGRLAQIDGRLATLRSRIEDAHFESEQLASQLGASSRSEAAAIQGWRRTTVAMRRAWNSPVLRWALLAAVIVVVFTMAGCADTPRGGVDMVVLLDSSSSTRECRGPCAAGALTAAYDTFEKVGRLRRGSRFKVRMVEEHVSGPPIFSVQVPQRWRGNVRVAKRDWSAAVRGDLASLEVRIIGDGSAVANAVWSARRDLDGSADRRILIIGSDLMDWSVGAYAPGCAAPPTPDEFLGRVKAAGSLPDLHGVEVIACGVQPSPERSDWTPADQDALESVWKAYFREAGASKFTAFERCDAAAFIRALEVKEADHASR